MQSFVCFLVVWLHEQPLKQIADQEAMTIRTTWVVVRELTNQPGKKGRLSFFDRSNQRAWEFAVVFVTIFRNN